MHIYLAYIFIAVRNSNVHKMWEVILRIINRIANQTDSVIQVSGRVNPPLKLRFE